MTLPIPGIHGGHPTTEWLIDATRVATSVQPEPAAREWPTPRRAPRPDVPAVDRPAWMRVALDSMALARASILSDSPDHETIVGHLRTAATEVKRAAAAAEREQR